MREYEPRKKIHSETRSFFDKFSQKTRLTEFSCSTKVKKTPSRWWALLGDTHMRHFSRWWKSQEFIAKWKKPWKKLLNIRTVSSHDHLSQTKRTLTNSTASPGNAVEFHYLYNRTRILRKSRQVIREHHFWKFAAKNQKRILRSEPELTSKHTVVNIAYSVHQFK